METMTQKLAELEGITEQQATRSIWAVQWAMSNPWKESKRDALGVSDWGGDFRKLAAALKDAQDKLGDDYYGYLVRDLFGPYGAVFAEHATAFSTSR